MEGGMTQLKHRALTSAITALSLAIVAVPLTIDQHGSVGISQALAKGGHHGHSASRTGSGEGSPNDVIADAKEKKAAIEASQDAAIMKHVNTLQQQLDAAELDPPSGLARVMIEREEKTLQTIGEGLPNDVIEDTKEKKAAIEASQDAAIMDGVNMLHQQLEAELKVSSGSAKVMIEGEEKTLQAIQKKL
jgi:hypothetical protein